MNNRFFSLLIIPESGGEVRTGSFNFELVVGVFTGLVFLFFICLFFIIGYHIKLSQEKSYKQVLLANKTLLKKINTSRDNYENLSNRLAKIQNNDKTFRNFNRMKVLDAAMYKAGIGGQSIVNTDYSSLSDGLAVDLKEINYGVTTLEHRTSVLESSYSEIRKAVYRNRDIYNNTPSIFPTHSFRFTSFYQWRTHPVTKRVHFHSAVDIAGFRGQKIYATADGVITNAQWQGPLGRCLKIKHKYGYETVYGHLEKMQVAVGDTVKKGDVIGAMGSSGTTTGVHVHYSIVLNGKPVNPLDYLK